MRGTLLFAMVMLMGACSPSMQGGEGEPVELSVEPTSLAAGETLTLTLRNRSSTGVGYNLCTSTLERRAEDAWESVPSERICTMELRTLAGGATTTYPLEITPDLEPGQYRVRSNVHIPETGSPVPVHSPSFQVTG